MRTRLLHRVPRRAVAAVLTAATLPAVAGTAVAATGTGAKPAAGSADSTLTLAHLDVLGKSAGVLAASLGAQDLSSPTTAGIDLTPLVLDGSAVGKQSLQAPVSKTVDAPGKSVAGVLSADPPPATVKASKEGAGPTASLQAPIDLSSIKLLGLPLHGTGSLSAVTTVTDRLAEGTKTLHLTDVGLPTLGDLLSGLGLDLSTLPAATLNDLLDQLNLPVTTAVTAANDALDKVSSTVDSLQSQLTDALGRLTDKQDALSSATSRLSDAQTALDGALGQLNSALAPAAGLLQLAGLPTSLGSGDLSSGVLSQLTSLPGLTARVPSLSNLVDSVTSANTDLLSAQNLDDTLNNAVDTLQGTVDGLRSQLDSVLGSKGTDLAKAVGDILDQTPLVSLHSLQIGTIADSGSKHTADVTGSADGLDVLGTDVLSKAGLGALDLGSVTSGALSQLQGAIDQLTGTLSSVLTGAVPGLSVPAPVVRLLQKSTSTAPQDGLSAALAEVTGLTVSWSGISLPPSVQLPGAPGLLSGHATKAHATLVPGFSLSLASLSDTSEFRPGVDAASHVDTTPAGQTPPAGTPHGGEVTPTASGQLAYTGLPALLPVAALLLLGGALVLRRLRGAAS